ncbi:MAG: hypothetical protein SOY63_08345 [Alloprevotella sp.]|nr:hypothetical protein [Alloprevotella sp.]
MSFSFRKNGTIFEAREEEKGAERVSFIYFQTVTGIRRRTTGLRAGFFGLMTGASKPQKSDESSRFGLFLSGTATVGDNYLHTIKVFSSFSTPVCEHSAAIVTPPPQRLSAGDAGWADQRLMFCEQGPTQALSF